MIFKRRNKANNNSLTGGVGSGSVGLSYDLQQLMSMLTDIHNHNNKDALDRLDVLRGYLYIDGEKTKAGISDYAYDLTDDSPIRTMYVSKLNDDVVNGVIKFNKATTYGNYIKDYDGGFVGMTDKGSYAEVDYLKVRQKAIYESLDIAETNHIAGKLIVTVGDGVTITNVEDTDNGYKCYFKASETDEDGQITNIVNRFKVNDQIYCKSTNLSDDGDIGNSYWWRLCVEVGADYFVLSHTDCSENSDIPVAGDKCVQLGNRLDANRQSAIILSTVDIDAPSLIMYGNIDGYVLSGREMFDMSVGADGTPHFNAYGDMYVGRKDLTSYVKYDSDGIEVKGKIDAQSTVSGQTIADYVNNTVFSTISNDGLLTPYEKKQIKNLMLEIYEEYKVIKAKAIEIGVDYSHYQTAYYDLINYLVGDDNVLLGLENDKGCLITEDVIETYLALERIGVLTYPDETTEIDRAEFELMFTNYYAERDALNLNELNGDYTSTVIDGGLVTTGSIELKGADNVTKAGITGNSNGDGNDIRIWAGETKENRNTAPFRVNQNGEMWATNAHIEGVVTANKMILGEGSVIVGYSAEQAQTDVPRYINYVLPLVEPNKVQTIDIMRIKTGQYDVYPFRFTIDGGIGKVGRNLTNIALMGTQYVLDELGVFRATGFNVRGMTFWNITKFND